MTARGPAGIRGILDAGTDFGGFPAADPVRPEAAAMVCPEAAAGVELNQ
jgi:hypothetical protein